MRRRRRVLAVLVCWVGLGTVSPCFASMGFVKGKETGWFWYEWREQPLVEELETAPPPPPPAQEREPPPAPGGLPPGFGSTSWLREHLPKYLEEANDRPTLENVTAYLLLQRLAMDKADRFAVVGSLATVFEPLLDPNRHRSYGSAGHLVTDQLAEQGLAEVLGGLRSAVGVWFFFDPAAPLSEVQARALDVLTRTHGLEVYPISLTGAPLQSGRYPSYVSDTGQAAALGVLEAPALFAVHATEGTIVPLGHGLTTTDVLEQRLVVLAKEAGWISAEEFARTQTVRSSLLPSQIVPAAVEAGPPVPVPAGLVVEELRRRLAAEQPGNRIIAR